MLSVIYAECHMLAAHVITLIVVMISIVMLSVTAPSQILYMNSQLLVPGFFT